MGIIPIPLKYPGNEKKFSNLLSILNECKPSCLVSTKALKTEEIYSIPWIELDEQYSTEAFVTPNTYSEIAFIQFTSGSTSDSKGIMISHDNLKLIGTYLTSDPVNQITASWLPHYHDMGLIGSYLATLYYGASGYYMAPTTFMTNPNIFLQLISDTKATLIQCPNVAYEYMASQWDNRDIDLSSIQNAINAAEPVHEETINKFYSVFEQKGFHKEAMKPTYGLAEATLFVSQSNTLYSKSCQGYMACGLCPDVDIRIVNPETQSECVEGQVGEI